MRVLVVSYTFPPVGGAGVQRVSKLVKYLTRQGVTTSVLTARNPSVPVLDPTLEREVPDGVEVIRARTLEPSYSQKELAWRASAHGSSGFSSRFAAAAVRIGKRLLVPDPQLLWLPAAGRELARRLRSPRPDDVVFISGPPFSQFLLAPLARSRPGTAVVVDYRDEWTTTGEFEMASSKAAAKLLEALVLRFAHLVTATTDDIRRALLGRHRFLDERQVLTIPNGYDPEDFTGILPRPPRDRCVVTYAGTVYRLTSARGFLEGLRRFHEREPALAKHLEVRFAGRIVPTEEHLFEGSEALGVTRLGYLEHRRAIEEVAGSHAALCIFDDVPGVERMYPAKVFEIMHLRTPCLALVPEGAVARLVRDCRAGEVVPPRDVEAIAAALSRVVQRFLGIAPPAACPVDVERFDRSLQAEAFAQAFRSAVELARDGSGRQPSPAPAAPT